MAIKRSNPTEISTEILAEEYEYIASTANQANEDRARVSSFYLVAVGSLVAALFSTQLFETREDHQTMSLLFSGLFVILTLLGTLTVAQLARLRAAWYESMTALNQIKEYAVSKDKDLGKAFRWRTGTMPPLYKINSISYQQTVEVAFLGGLTFGAAIHFLQAGLSYDCTVCNWAYTIAGALLALIAQLFLYKQMLMQK